MKLSAMYTYDFVMREVWHDHTEVEVTSVILMTALVFTKSSEDGLQQSHYTV